MAGRRSVRFPYRGSMHKWRNAVCTVQVRHDGKQIVVLVGYGSHLQFVSVVMARYFRVILTSG